MEVMYLPQSMHVYPAPRVSPQGRGGYVYVKEDGTQIPAGRTFAKQAEKRYCFPTSKDGLKLETGLNELISNPFTNDEIADKYIKDQWASRRDELQGKDQITLQTYFEVLHNRPPGTYTDEKKVRRPFDTKAEENTFFESYSVALSDGTNIFTSDSIEGQLNMILMKASPSVANSKEECNNALHDFYIGAAHEAVIETQNKRKVQGRAIARLNNIYDNYPDFIVYQIATVLELVKGPVNAVMTRNVLDDFLWKQDKTLSDRISRFNKVTDKIDSREGMEELYLRYVLQQAINTNCLGIENGNYIWYAKKHVKNLYNLGTNSSKVFNTFAIEMNKYDPNLEVENFYGDLIEELRYKGVKLIEEEKPAKAPEISTGVDEETVVEIPRKRGRPKSK